MPRKREQDPKLNNGSGDQDGQIRIFKRENRRHHFRREVLIGTLVAAFMLTAFLMTAMLMKAYTDRKVAESSSQLTRDANSFSEFERWVYGRESFRRVYDDFTPFMAGVAASEQAFNTDDYDILTTGIIIDDNGNILAPARILRGRTTAFVRTVKEGVEEITEASIVGVDEPTGVALISVPALARNIVPRTSDRLGAHLETMIHMAMPKGEPDKGNLTLSGIQSANAQYTVDTGNSQTKIQAFSLHNPINAQTDGGAILDIDGNLVGMASLDLSRELKFYPYLAGIPADELLAIVERIHRGEFTALSFGTTGTSVKNDAIPGTGYYVLEVTPGSTADRGGLAPTDIIISIDGQPFVESRTIDSYLIGRRVGNEVLVEVLQGSEIKMLKVRIY